MAVTPNYGWPIPVATDYVKDGYDAIADLGNAIDTTVAGLGSGLTLVKSQAVGTAVSSVIVTNAFSATYDNYRVIYIGGTSTANSYFQVLLRTGSTNSTTGYYFSQNYSQFGAGGVASEQGNNDSSIRYMGYHSNTDGQTNLNFEIYSPFRAYPTTFKYDYVTNDRRGNGNGVHKVSTSYDQFVFQPESGTITGGTVYVYGYQK